MIVRPPLAHLRHLEMTRSNKPRTILARLTANAKKGFQGRRATLRAIPTLGVEIPFAPSKQIVPTDDLAKASPSSLR
jgi:hypothetical protein